jgi:hypothetical protein
MVQNTNRYCFKTIGQYFRGNIGIEILVNKFVFYATNIYTNFNHKTIILTVFWTPFERLCSFAGPVTWPRGLRTPQIAGMLRAIGQYSSVAKPRASRHVFVQTSPLSASNPKPRLEVLSRFNQQIIQDFSWVRLAVWCCSLQLSLVARMINPRH